MTITEFDTQFKSLQHKLQRFAYQLTNNSEDTTDLIQETALRAIKNLDKYVDNTNFKAWMMTIMRNIFINDYRRKVKRNIISDNTENQLLLDNYGPLAYNQGESSVLMEELSGMVGQLSDDLRVPFLMHYSGYKYQEIADDMQLPLGTVKSRIFFARKALKEMIRLQYAARTMAELSTGQ
jgi:RNA polymerase sigma-70 factor (ECF subfamily)